MIVDQIPTQPYLDEPSKVGSEKVVKVGSKRKLYVMYALMLISSTIVTIIAKLMTLNVKIPNQALIESACCFDMICHICKAESFQIVKFTHPLLMVILMFLGEVLCLPFGYWLKPEPILEDQVLQPPVCLSYCLGGSTKPEVSEEKKPQVKRLSPLVYILPASFDIVGSLLSFAGLGLLHASTFQILRILCLCFVTLLSKVFFKRRFTLRQWLAMVLILAGLIMVSVQSLLQARAEQNKWKRRDRKNDVAIGISLMVVSQFVLACLGIQEEFLLRNQRGGNPLLMMGW